MTNLLLIPIIPMIFIIGYILMSRFIIFKQTAFNKTHKQRKTPRARIRIAAESLAVLEAVTKHLKAYSRTCQKVSFKLFTEKETTVLQNLSSNTIDFAVITDSKMVSSAESLGILPVPKRKINSLSSAFESKSGMHDSNFYIVWNKSSDSKIRDSILYAMEAEFSSIKCGYADYIN